MSLSTLGSTLIPCPLCDALPYDEPTDLAAHLATECPGRNAPPTLPAAPVPAPVSPAPTAVRSFSPGGTRATNTKPARKERGPTDPMIGFIRDLVGAVPDAELPDFSQLTFTAASAMIDDLKGRRAAARSAAPAARPAPSSHGIDLEHGRVYAMADGTFVKVTESKAGNLYGKLLDADGKFTDYQKGLLGRIARHLTAEEAARFGHEHARCVFCSRNLSDEKDGRSVDVGYGPICADKYGLPWG